MKNKKFRTLTLRLLFFAVLAFVFCLYADKPNTAKAETRESKALRDKQIAQLKIFAIEKEKQSLALADAAGEKFSLEFRRYFDAALKGDWQTVTNMFDGFKKHHPQYDNKKPDLNLRVSYWSPVLEIGLAYELVANCEPKATDVVVNGIIDSIPAGSIYFGGTDPGRGLPTAFSKSHVNGDPFFTLTQNALADGTYLKYLRSMYGGKIYTPTDKDSQRCFNEYLEDAQKRYESKSLKPGEDFKITEGKVQVSGQMAVMSINALLTKVIFDKNPDREFFIEESFPLDWMYPHLEPHGLILKINRQPLKELSEKSVQKDRDFWQPHIDGMIGDWLTEATSVKTLTEFAEKVYLRKDLKDFKGDPQFVGNKDTQKIFSKLRSSIGDLYAWRVSNRTNPAEQTRMVHATDFAFRQAVALCPYSPEAVFRYVNFLLSLNRIPDAILVVKTAQKLDPENTSFKALSEQLEGMHKQNEQQNEKRLL